MAYGNYGAIVTKNGERCPGREDNTPYKEDDMPAGYYQAFLRSEGANPHHAVIGDGDIRLCAHKTYPSLLFKGEEVDLKQFYSGKLEKYGDNEYLPDECEMSFSFEGHEIKIEAGEHLFLELTAPDGTAWKAEIGYCFGAGHTD